MSSSSSGARPPVDAALSSLLRRDAIRSIFHLAHHEFRDLAPPAGGMDVALLRRTSCWLHVLAAPRDKFFPQSHYDRVAATVPGLEVQNKLNLGDFISSTCLL